MNNKEFRIFNDSDSQLNQVHRKRKRNKKTKYILDIFKQLFNFDRA